MSVLINSEAELRSGWKCLLWLGVFIALVIATSAALAMVVGTVPLTNVERLALNAIILLASALGALAFMARFVDKAPLTRYGLGLGRRSGREFGAGIGLAAAMLAGYLAAQAAAGLSLTPAPRDGDFWPQWGLLLLILAVSAAGEELVFRGYPFQALVGGLGAWPAILLASALFGVAHALNPNASALGAFNTFIAGVLLSLAYLRTRSLWLPFGIHIGWNAGLGPVLGLPVSGNRMQSIWMGLPAGPDWITGGAFGPEGGVPATVVMTAAAVWLAVTKPRSAVDFGD